MNSNGQEGDRLDKVYFDDHKAQSQAIIVARYAEASYRYTYELMKFSLLYGEKRATPVDRHCDTARAFLQRAFDHLDSAFHFASDSSVKAIQRLHRSERYLERGKKLLEAYDRSKERERKEKIAEMAMYSLTNGSVDAFHASLLFKSRDSLSREDKKKLAKKEKKKGKYESENIYDALPSIKKGGKRKKEEEAYKKEVSRLELDRETFRTLSEKYEERIEVKEERIDSLEVKGGNEERIGELKEEKEILELKHDDAEGQVSSISQMLKEKLLKKVGLDSTSGPNRSKFEVNRVGYYDKDNPVPIDEEQPDGLIYRIQIGYYTKGNKPEEKFKGLYPIWGEQVSDKYIRYCVGEFRSYDEADKAKEYLKERRIEGAFIVAYKDGKKISVVDAVKMERNQ